MKELEYSAELKIHSSMMDDVELSSSFLTNPTSTLLGVHGRYSQQDISANIEYQHPKHLVHSLVIRAAKNEKVFFKSSFNIDMGRQKSLAVTIFAGRRITLDALVCFVF